MKLFKLIIFTAFCFLAFRQDVEAVETKPAFPIVVESSVDPPDCTQALSYKCIEIVSIEARCLICATELATDCFMNTTTQNGINSGPLTFQEPLNILLERNAAFGYSCFTAAGGVGRTQRCFAKLRYNYTASLQESFD